MTKWGDEAAKEVALAMIKPITECGYAGDDGDGAWNYPHYFTVDGEVDLVAVARAAIIATLECLATPSEAMRGAAKFSESQIPLGNGTSVTVAGGLGDLPFDYWRMLDAAKREIEGT